MISEFMQLQIFIGIFREWDMSKLNLVVNSVKSSLQETFIYSGRF